MDTDDATLSLNGAFVSLRASDGSYVRMCVNSRALTPLSTPEGQTIEDIIVGTVGRPRDAQIYIEFYRALAPHITTVAIPLNARATFRWVPYPEREIKLGPADQLHWRVATQSPGLGEDWHIGVFTRGACRQSGRVIVNQSDWTDVDDPTTTMSLGVH